MKAFSSAPVFVVAGLVAAGFASAIVASSATFAATATFADFDTSVKSELGTLKIPASDIGKLTVAEVAHLRVILDGKGKAPIKAVSAKFVIDEALHPSTVSLDSPEGQKMVSDLTAKLSALQLTYPTEPLTATQVQALLDVTGGHGGKHGKHGAGGVKAVLASLAKPAPAVATSDVMAMESDMDAKLTGAGLTPPAPGTMTYDQLGQLETIFANGGTVDDQKAAAMKVLG